MRISQLDLKAIISVYLGLDVCRQKKLWQRFIRKVSASWDDGEILCLYSCICLISKGSRRIFYVLCYYQEKNNKCQKSVLIDELDRLGLS